MRVIAGKHRGRRLLGPVGTTTTRPITDRVKTALFDRLAAAGRLEGAVVADLFCGTGSLGIECLSRGARHVTFIERDRVARDRLTRNIESIGQSRDAAVLALDALSPGVASALADRGCTLAFMDPPYRLMANPREGRHVYRQIGRLASAMTNAGLIVLRLEARTTPEAVAPCAAPSIHRYGSMALCFYEPLRGSHRTA